VHNYCLYFFQIKLISSLQQDHYGVAALAFAGSPCCALGAAGFIYGNNTIVAIVSEKVN